MKVFIGGLPWGVDNERLREVFSEHGPVTEAIVVFDKETGKSRGFGFVTFSDQDDAEKMIAMGGLDIDGRTVRIDHANDKRKERGSGSGHGRTREPAREDNEPRYEERRSGRRQDRSRQRGNR